MKKIIDHFAKTDPTMAELVAIWIKSDDSVPKELKPQDYIVDLYSSIISQQISTKAAATIKKRFFEQINDIRDPQEVLNISQESLRGFGLSRQKASYIHSIAENALSGNVDFESLNNLGDEAVILELTKIKGVGRWTAEMFLIFSLARPDIFSIGDLGLQNAIKNNYKLKKLSVDNITKLSNKWSPHRTIASLALWHSLDNKPN